jgi:hypothetical protein
MLELESALYEKAGFLFAGPAESPSGGYQILQQRFFGRADGLIFGYEGIAEEIERGPLFVHGDEHFGSEPVFQGVVADDSASFRCGGAGALLCIAAICVDLKLSCHFYPNGTGEFAECNSDGAQGYCK